MSSLNDSHKRAILSSFLGINRRLTELEAAMAAGGDGSPFAQSVVDLSPDECATVREDFARLRRAMADSLAALEVPLDVRRTSLRWALQCTLVFIGNTIADIGPDRLRGYGPVDPAARERVLQAQAELQRLVDRMTTSLPPAASSPGAT
jgi:hypothetical protein